MIELVARPSNIKLTCTYSFILIEFMLLAFDNAMRRNRSGVNLIKIEEKAQVSLILKCICFLPDSARLRVMSYSVLTIDS